MTIGRTSWDRVWLEMAVSISGRSRCDKAKVGCVLVSEDNQMIAASYNGPAPKWKPPNIVAVSTYDGRQEIKASRPITDHCSDWCPRAKNPESTDQSYSDCVSLHAEVNAIARADRSRMTNAKAYVSTSLCISCAKALVAAGVSRIIYLRGNDAHRSPQNVLDYLQSCGVSVWGFDNVSDL